MRSKRAFSLIEAAVVLAIVGLTIGAIWVVAAEINLNNRINETSKGFVMISNNIRRIYEGRPPATDAQLDRETGWSMGVFDGASGFSYRHDPVITSQRTFTPLNNRYTLIYIRAAGTIGLNVAPALTPVECIKLVSAISAAAASQIVSITIGMTPFYVMPMIPTTAQCTYVGALSISIRL